MALIPQIKKILSDGDLGISMVEKVLEMIGVSIDLKYWVKIASWLISDLKNKNFKGGFGSFVSLLREMIRKFSIEVDVNVRIGNFLILKKKLSFGLSKILNFIGGPNVDQKPDSKPRKDATESRGTLMSMIGEKVTKLGEWVGKVSQKINFFGGLVKSVGGFFKSFF